MSEAYISAEQDYMAGMKYKEIADKYEVSLNTVKSRRPASSLGLIKKGGH